MIKIKPIPAQIADLDGILPPATSRRLLISAVNDATRWGETRINRLARETIALSRKGVDDAISRTTTRDDAGGFGQRISVSRSDVDLKDYKPRQVRLGLSVRLLKSGPREVIEDAFIVDRLGQHAFKRVDEDERLPIHKLKGPTVIGAMLRRDAEVERIRIDTADRVMERFISKVDFELVRAAKKSKR